MDGINPLLPPPAGGGGAARLAGRDGGGPPAARWPSRTCHTCTPRHLRPGQVCARCKCCER